jgi:hypothetical protein
MRNSRIAFRGQRSLTNLADSLQTPSLNFTIYPLNVLSELPGKGKKPFNLLGFSRPRRLLVGALILIRRLVS